MSLARFPCVSCVLAAVLAWPSPSSAFDTSLSDTAVREAYFLGQHHDDIFTAFLKKYVIALQPPKQGPHIASVSFFTPYALAAIYSNQQLSSYSAQQAQLDHQKQPELVRVAVQIWFTDSYSQYIVHPIDSRSGSPNGFELRSYDFWRQFRVSVYQNERFVVPVNAYGEPSVWCGDQCELTGATLTFEYPAKDFEQNTVTIQVTPPEGDPVAVDFDLTSFR